MKTKSVHWNFTSWSMIAFYSICGLLLLLWPNLALLIANYALAAALCAVGVAMIVGYLRAEALEGMLGYGLAKGLVLTLIAVMLFVDPNMLITLLPWLWGIAMIAGGFAKLQMAFDLKRVSHVRWWTLLIGALISLVLGLFSVTRPAFLALVVTQFAGISLLVEAVLDTVATLVMKRTFKNLKVEATVS